MEQTKLSGSQADWVPLLLSLFLGTVNIAVQLAGKQPSHSVDSKTCGQIEAIPISEATSSANRYGSVLALDLSSSPCCTEVISCVWGRAVAGILPSIRRGQTRAQTCHLEETFARSRGYLTELLALLLAFIILRTLH